jgi:hypothetical protein
MSALTLDVIERNRIYLANTTRDARYVRLCASDSNGSSNGRDSLQVLARVYRHVTS